MTGLFTAALFREKPLIEVGRHAPRGWTGAALWMVVAVAGWTMVWHGGATLYLGLILGLVRAGVGRLWCCARRVSQRRRRYC